MAIDKVVEAPFMRRLRVVFDTNVYVAAYLSKNPRSPNKELFRRWRGGEFVLLVFDAILQEVIEKFDHMLDGLHFLYIVKDDKKPSA